MSINWYACIGGGVRWGYTSEIIKCHIGTEVSYGGVIHFKV